MTYGRNLMTAGVNPKATGMTWPAHLFDVGIPGSLFSLVLPGTNFHLGLPSQGSALTDLGGRGNHYSVSSTAQASAGVKADWFIGTQTTHLKYTNAATTQDAIFAARGEATFAQVVRTKPGAGVVQLIQPDSGSGNSRRIQILANASLDITMAAYYDAFNKTNALNRKFSTPYADAATAFQLLVVTISRDRIVCYAANPSFGIGADMDSQYPPNAEIPLQASGGVPCAQNMTGVQFGGPTFKQAARGDNLFDSQWSMLANYEAALTPPQVGLLSRRVGLFFEARGLPVLPVSVTGVRHLT